MVPATELDNLSGTRKLQALVYDIFPSRRKVPESDARSVWFQLIPSPSHPAPEGAAGAKTVQASVAERSDRGGGVVPRADSALPESSVFDLSAPPHKFTTRVERSRGTVAVKREKTNTRGMGEERERDRG